MKSILLKPSLIVILSTLLSGITGYSATVTVIIDNGLWGDAGTWNGATGTGGLPGTADTAVINQGKTVNVDSVVGTEAGIVRVSNTNTGQSMSTLNVLSGSLTIGLLQIAQGATDPGRVNISGGTLTSSLQGTQIIAQGSGELNISNGGIFNADDSVVDNTVKTFNVETMTINGGTLTTNDRIRFAFGVNGTLKVIGSSSTLNGKDLQQTASANTQTFEWIFDATGISPISMSGFANPSGIDVINIDGSLYSGGAGTFDLISAVNIADVFSGTLNVTGLGEQGVGWNFIQSVDDNLFQIQVVPEPSTFAFMLGLAALGLVAWRRRNAR